MQHSGRRKACLQMLPELLEIAAELDHLPRALLSNPLMHGCHFVLLIQLTLQSLLSQGAAVLVFFEQQLQLLPPKKPILRLLMKGKKPSAPPSNSQPALTGGCMLIALRNHLGR